MNDKNPHLLALRCLISRLSFSDPESHKPQEKKLGNCWQLAEKDQWSTIKLASTIIKSASTKIKSASTKFWVGGDKNGGGNNKTLHDLLEYKRRSPGQDSYLCQSEKKGLGIT